VFFPKEKMVMTGNPIRKEIIENKIGKAEAASFFQLDENKKTILVVGGSLGAGTINRSIEKELKRFKDNGWQLIWQTGKFYYQQAQEAVKNLQYQGVLVKEFIYEMDKAYAMADFIVSRAGALAISELSNIGKPTILIPSPNVAEDHQTKNAMALVNKEAVIMIKDVEAEGKLGNTLSVLINSNKGATLSKNIKALAIKDAADRIVKEIEKLIG